MTDQKKITEERHQDNLAGIYGRRAQEFARAIERGPTDLERKLGTFALQAMAALQEIDQNMADLAGMLILAPGPRDRVAGTQRLALNLAVEIQLALVDAGLGTDPDGDPDPFAQVGR
jgi:hypothetical protein